MTSQAAETASFFIDSQRELLRTVLNRLIPASGSFPGAGDLGIASYIEKVVGQSVALRRLFAQGLAQIEIACQPLSGQEFADLLDHQKDTVLRQVEATNPEFFSALVTHTYSGYYSNPLVVRLLGLEVRPPQPQGYKLEPFDLGLVDTIRQRGPLYRHV
jgi:hypothetical protein